MKSVFIACAAFAISSYATEIQKDTIVDPRDGQKYATVKIGEQTWFAQNLNYKVEGLSSCYEGKKSNCEQYGRLYGKAALKGVCPVGWHVADNKEWGSLIFIAVQHCNPKFSKGYAAALAIAQSDCEDQDCRANAKAELDAELRNSDCPVKLLKSTVYEGLDPFGFALLFGGKLEREWYNEVGAYGYYWQATGLRYLGFYESGNLEESDYETDKRRFSIRCVKD